MKWGVRRDQYTDSRATGITLAKDSVIKRVAGAGDEKQAGMKYAAFKPDDIDMYELMLGGSEKFNFSYKVKDVLRSPNEKRQFDAFFETVKDMSVSKVAATLKKKSKLSTLRGIEKELTKAVEGNIKSKVRTYDKFVELLYADELEPVRKSYFDKLSKEGYNMIIDSSDKGVISNSPILIFNGSKSLAFVSKKKLE